MNAIFTFRINRQRYGNHKTSRCPSQDFVPLSMLSAMASLLVLNVGCVLPSDEVGASTGTATMMSTESGIPTNSNGTTSLGTGTTTQVSTTDASSGTTESSTSSGDTSDPTMQDADSTSETTTSSGTTDASTSTSTDTTGDETTGTNTSSESESTNSDSASESSSSDESSNSSSSSESESIGSTSEDSGETGDDPTTVTLEHIGRGAFNSRFVVENTGAPWKVISGSYQIRHIGSSDNQSAPASRDYFSFSLNGVQGTVATAELHITHPGNSYDSADPTETITLYDISTPTVDLETPDEKGDISVLEGIFHDIGSGNEYGSFVADASSDDTVEIVSLNATALADIQTAISNGTDWAIGGSLTSPADTLTFGTFERVFRGSDASGGTPQPAAKLVLTGHLSQ